MHRGLAFLLMTGIMYCSVTGMMGDSVAKASENVDAEEVTEITEHEKIDEEVIEIAENEESDEEVTENQVIDEETDEAETGKETERIYNVSFPAGAKAFLDPENLSGRGQIFSDDFKVENYGNTDIAVKIKNIEVYIKSTEEAYEFSDEEVLDKHSNIKKINVDVVWKNEQDNTENVLNVLDGVSDEYVLFLKKSEYDEDGGFIRLNDGSTGLFYFTGTLNSNPELVWEDGEVMVSFDYEIVDMTEDMEEDTLEIEQEEPDTGEAGEEKETPDAENEMTRQNQPDAGKEEGEEKETDAENKKDRQNQPDASVKEEDKQ